MDRLQQPRPGRSVSLVLGPTILHRQSGDRIRDRARVHRAPRRSRPFLASAFMPSFFVMAAVRGTLGRVLDMSHLYRRFTGRLRLDKPVQYVRLSIQPGTHE